MYSFHTMSLILDFEYTSLVMVIEQVLTGWQMLVLSPPHYTIASIISQSILTDRITLTLKALEKKEELLLGEQSLFEDF